MEQLDDEEQELNSFEKIPASDLIRTTDGFLFNPYNPLNIEIKEGEVKDILKRYGLPPIVSNMELYKRAFVHRSYLKYPAAKNEELKITLVERPPDCMPLRSKSNERLEFVGDGVLELITKYYLYLLNILFNSTDYFFHFRIIVLGNFCISFENC